MSITTFLRDVPRSRLTGLLWLALSETAEVQSRQVVSDAGGGGTTTWPVSGTVPCRLDPAAGGGGIIGGRIDERTTHIVTTAPEAEVTSDSRLVLAGKGTYDVLYAHERTGAQTKRFEVFKVT